MNLRCSVLLLFAVLTLATSGCSRIAANAPGARNSWTVPGLLRIVDLSEPDTLNPEVGDQQIDNDLAQLWAGYFFNYSDRNTLDPELVTVEPTLANGGISKDGKTIEYHLRPGVLWQDGAPFTAADVLFTWHAILNKKNNVGSTQGYDDVRAIDVRDPHTIVVHLKERYAPFVATFFSQSGEPYPVLPKHVLAKYSDINRIPFNSQPIGTGPFVVEKWERGNKIVFRANPHYWRGAPKLKEIWYTPVGDENTIATLLGSHQADLEYHGAANNWSQLRHIEGFKTVLTPFTEYGLLALNTTSPQLSDVRVRQALWYAYNTKGAIEAITHGVDVLGTTDQPAFGPWFDPRAQRYPYDPAKARALLDAAGWHPGSDGIRVKDGQRLAITIAGVAGSANGNAVNIFAQRNWHDVGIEANVKTYVSSLFFASYGGGGIVQTDKFDAAFFEWISGADPDDSSQFLCSQIPPGGQNVYRLCDPKIDAAEKIALANYDPAVRKRAYDTIQELTSLEVPQIITWYVRRISVENTDLKGYSPAHAVSSFWNSYDWSI